jgi:DNA-binding transcriptional regulator YiaG
MKNSKAKATPRKPLGRRIGDSLREAVSALESGKKLSDVFRVDTIEIADPPTYGAADVKRLREQLGLTQRMLAKVLGVSAELVEHWEQGIRVPRPMACRLLSAVERDPEAFLRRVVVSK